MTAYIRCTVDPASDAVSVASIPPAPWHFRMLDIERDKAKRQRFTRYPIGFCHIDIAEVQTDQGKLYAGPAGSAP